jgi:hypothetical protein
MIARYISKKASPVEPEIDGDEAVAFLEVLRPEGRWILTAIAPDDTRTFTETFTDLECARHFILSHNKRGRGIYYSVNPTKTALNKKASKEDIAAAEYLWVDIDPKADETPAQLKSRVDKMKSPQLPSVIVDSGNGVQLLFRIKKALLDSAKAIADIEARNYALAIAFDANPSTRNIDRILRVPGTINYPNAAKIKVGRVECRARLIGKFHRDRIYKLSDFPPYVAAKAESPKADKKQKSDSDIPPQLQALLLLKSGVGEAIAGYKTRSGLLFAFLTGALFKGLSEEMIENACLDATYRGCAIFEHCTEKGGLKYIREQLERAKARSEEKGAKNNAAKVKQSDILIEIAVEESKLFSSPDAIAYADIIVDGHRETWPIRSRGFRFWLVGRYYAQTKSAPNSESISMALTVIEARCRYEEGDKHEVYLRVVEVAEQRGKTVERKVYLDLADDDWCVVEIDKDDWRVLTDPAPVRFARRQNMLALPMPVRGGAVDDLRPFLNVTANEFILVVAYLLAALRGRGPYPIFIPLGEAGVAKSSLSRVIKSLVDPTTAPLRAPPRENRDLFVAANNSFLIIFDNLSDLPDWLSDSLCRLATGGGFSTRQLYTDEEEKVFDAKRPIILNAIENVVVRGDLADRSMFAHLKVITEKKRRTEDEFWRAFEAKRAGILGALLDVVAHGLSNLRAENALERKPRMADFLTWITACEDALWEEGKFAEVYNENRTNATADIIEADWVAMAIEAFMTKRGENDEADWVVDEKNGIRVLNWSGENGQLLKELQHFVDDEARKSKGWPKSGNKLSGRIKKAAPALRKNGIGIREGRNPDNNRRTWTFTTREYIDKEP